MHSYSNMYKIMQTAVCESVCNVRSVSAHSTVKWLLCILDEAGSR